MRENMENLFYQHKVNMVFTGHVHAYERSHPVYQGIKTADGPVHLVIGDGGNAEGHSNTYVEPIPSWSAYRNGTQFGHGVIHFYNESHMEWQWHRNIDHEPVVTDSYVLCNTALGMNADCSSAL
jgi:acid phosphatase type 7